jgi:hypothetical protein
MKTFKQLIEENQQINEGGEMYPADEMTMKELKIACYAAQNILDRLEDGAMIQRWQISAVVKASEELASVYTSMSADEHDDDEMEDDMYYDEYGYPRMYGEAADTHKTKDGRTAKKGLWYNINQRKKKGLPSKKPGDEGYPDTLKIEEADFEVDVEGLPRMYVKANSPTEVKASLRKIVKKPDMIRSVERMTSASVKKIFRDKASGKSDTEE